MTIMRWTLLALCAFAGVWAVVSLRDELYEINIDDEDMAEEAEAWEQFLNIELQDEDRDEFRIDRIDSEPRPPPPAGTSPTPFYFDESVGEAAAADDEL